MPHNMWSNFYDYYEETFGFSRGHTGEIKQIDDWLEENAGIIWIEEPPGNESPAYKNGFYTYEISNEKKLMEFLLKHW